MLTGFFKAAYIDNVGRQWRQKRTECKRNNIIQYPSFSSTRSTHGRRSVRGCRNNPSKTWINNGLWESYDMGQGSNNSLKASRFVVVKKPVAEKRAISHLLMSLPLLHNPLIQPGGFNFGRDTLWRRSQGKLSKSQSEWHILWAGATGSVLGLAAWSRLQAGQWNSMLEGERLWR